MTDKQENHSQEHDFGLATKERIQTKAPHLYQVFLLNDDYTPMEFVVEVLQSIFHKSPEEAHQLMWRVHTEGQGKCGTYTYDIAQTKVYQVKTLAKQNQHPLECIMEESAS